MYLANYAELHNALSCIVLLNQSVRNMVFFPRKTTFYVCDKFMRIPQNGPLDNLFMRSSVLCIVIYGAIKVYAVQIYATSA